MMAAMLRTLVAGCAATLALAGPGLDARQDPGAVAIRVNGQISVEGGGPLAAARIATDALRGPMAAQFIAQKVFTTVSDADGNWSLLGLSRGLWIFEISAPRHLPHVVIVPIAMMLRPESGAGPWETSLALLPYEAIGPPEIQTAAPERYLFEAARHAMAKDTQAARRALRQLVGANLHAGSLVGAGDVALLLRDAGMAQRFFELAATAAPDWYRPHLGVASASLVNFDVDRAIKAYGEARSRSKNTRLQYMLSSAIRDLQQIRSIGDR